MILIYHQDKVFIWLFTIKFSEDRFL